MRRISYEEMVQLMDYNEPPRDKAGRDAYFAEFEERVEPEDLQHMQLLAGWGPAAYWEWLRAA